MLDVLRTLFRTSFTNLSFGKRWAMRLAVVGVLVGGALVAMDMRDAATAAGIDWSELSFTAGLGFIGGFLAGAAIRLFMKVAFFALFAFVALGFGLSYMGWLDLPWESWGEALSATGAVLERGTESVRALLTGYLPAGGATAAGLGAGLTQRPRFDDDTD